MDLRVFWSFNPKTNLFAFDLNNTNFDVIVDCDTFAQLTRKNEHSLVSFNILVKETFNC